MLFDVVVGLVRGGVGPNAFPPTSHGGDHLPGGRCLLAGLGGCRIGAIAGLQQC